ncbi:hypothetical protein [Virgibacillus ainsalahensis]
MKKILVLVLCCYLLFTTLSACQKEYSGEYIEWGEQTNSNATELLEENNIPYEIRNGIIYIPEDAFDKAIYCCS